MQVYYKFPIISKYFRYCLRLYILACLVLTLCLILYVLFFENFMNERTYNNLELKSSIDKNEPKLPTIFCLVLTQKEDLNTEAKLMYDTWVKNCDKHKYITLIPDGLKPNITNYNESRGIEIKYNNNLELFQPPGYFEENYAVLTDKVFKSFVHLYDNYEPFDWYFKADDDTYVFMDNLRKFISNKNSSIPVTYGFDYQARVEKGYHSGGAGYLLSKGAFSLLGSVLSVDYNFCPRSEAEDVDVANCLRILKVYPEKSLDEKGRERFHALNIKRHYSGDWSKPYNWIVNFASNKLKGGLDCCSDESITFHYMYEKEVRIVHDFVEKCKLNSKKFTFADLIKELKY